MKKLFAVLLALSLLLGLTSFAAAESAIDPDLIAAAQAEGELVVYGSCEEEYLQAACDKFTELYGIKVTHQRLSTGEVQAKIEEENGNPSADVWFGGTTDPYNMCACCCPMRRRMLPTSSATRTATRTATGTASTRASSASW